MLLLGVTGILSGCGSSVAVNGSSNVPPPPAATLTALVIAPANPSIALGLTQQFTASGTYSDGSKKDLSTSVTWSSASTNVATISNVGGTVGLATAVNTGSTVITAALGSVSTTTTLTVTAAALQSIVVTPTNTSVAKGASQAFTATGTYSNNTTQNLTATAVWTSSAPGVASISNAAGSAGVASTLTPGSTTITAALTGITGSTTLTVTAPSLVSIAVTPLNPVTSIGGTVQFIATGTYGDGGTQILTASATWNSATATTATISNTAGTNGLATGDALGTTGITATVGAVTSPADTLKVASAFAYAANFSIGQQTGSISQYVINPDGTLTPNTQGATVPAGANPFAMVTDSSGKYVYVANYNRPGSNPTTISQYAIQATGVLMPIGMTGSVNAIGTGANGLAANPTGPYLYVTDLNTDNIAQFTIGANGALTPMSALVTQTAGSNPADIVLNPSGKNAYVVNFGSNNVSQYAVAADGSLVPMSMPVQAGTQPSFAAVDPTGSYLYVTNIQSASVSQYTISKTDGSLTPMTPAEVPMAPGVRTWSITLDAAGRYAYVVNRGNTGGTGGDSITQCKIGVGGALTVVGTPLTLTPGTNPNSLAIDPTGRFAYVTDRGTDTTPHTTVSQYLIGANGALSAQPMTNTVQAGIAPAAIITAR